MFSLRKTAKKGEWSLSKRLMSRIIVISTFITVLVSGSVAIHYGYDIPELQQRTLYYLSQDVERNLNYKASGEEMRKDINSRIDLFDRFPTAYEWHVLDGAGNLVASSTPADAGRQRFPPGLPPAEWDAPTVKGGWAAGKTFNKGGVVRHVITVAHSDPGGLLVSLAWGEALMHVVLPLVPFTFLIWFVISNTIRRTLQPLQSLAEQAKRVQSMDDIRPLDPKGSPLEVAELVKALNISLEKLRTSIEAEKRFLQDAAHALRTPLAIVKARLELDGEKVDKNSMLEEVDALIRLATQLLASANAERLVLKANARAELSSLARDAVSSMTPLAIRAGIDLGYSDDGQEAAVRGDTDAISHALKNLVENALKFTPRGKAVTVHVSHNPPTITVHDEGPGVPAGKEHAIFTRHSRGKFGDGKGAGLGLSIVQRIMHAHGGEASLAKSDEPGASFQLAFPVPPRETSANDDEPHRTAAAA
jgi:two-component system OmpR family sensor kinase